MDRYLITVQITNAPAPPCVPGKGGEFQLKGVCDVPLSLRTVLRPDRAGTDPGHGLVGRCSLRRRRRLISPSPLIGEGPLTGPFFVAPVAPAYSAAHSETHNDTT